MPIRRLALDVDEVVGQPDLVTLARSLEAVAGVNAVNITVTEIDVETVGTDVTIEGDDIDVAAVYTAIETAGAVLHSVDEVAAGSHVIERVPRVR